MLDIPDAHISVLSDRLMLSSGSPTPANRTNKSQIDAARVGIRLQRTLNSGS